MAAKDPNYHKNYYKEHEEKIKKQLKDNYKKNKRKRIHYSRVYSSESKMKAKYNRPVKNLIRDRIISEIQRRDIKTILTLESEDFLFAEEIPQKKVYVFEIDKKIHNLMRKNKPRNVILNQGGISDFSEYDMDVDCIYLDFCCTFKTAKEEIYLLKEKISKSKLFIVTFCTWDETKSPDGDYQFELINKLQTMLEINFKVIFGQGYRDKKHSTMVTIILENGIQ